MAQHLEGKGLSGARPGQASPEGRRRDQPRSRSRRVGRPPTPSVFAAGGAHLVLGCDLVGDERRGGALALVNARHHPDRRNGHEDPSSGAFTRDPRLALSRRGDDRDPEGGGPANPARSTPSDATRPWRPGCLGEFDPTTSSWLRLRLSRRALIPVLARGAGQGDSSSYGRRRRMKQGRLPVGRARPRPCPAVERDRRRGPRGPARDRPPGLSGPAWTRGSTGRAAFLAGLPRTPRLRRPATVSLVERVRAPEGDGRGRPPRDGRRARCRGRPAR